MTTILQRQACRITLIACVAMFLAACNKSTPTETKRFHVKGKVVSVDKSAGSANVDAEAIPGYMDAMTMPYPIKPANMLDQLSPGDTITGDVVIQNDAYWLENVTVTGHSTAPAAKPTSSLHMPAAGEAVPDFRLTNQDGKRISLLQFRGKTLLVTFIYTRCPFPDYCPRMTGEFAQIDRELRTNAALYGQTHLLSISIDPKHDTPKALRDYARLNIVKENPATFRHWEFAVPTATDLPQIASFFGLTVQQDGATITHSLSTAVIGPDGRIFRWYYGGDWQPAELIKDAASAMHVTV